MQTLVRYYLVIAVVACAVHTAGMSVPERPEACLIKLCVFSFYQMLAYQLVCYGHSQFFYLSLQLRLSNVTVKL